MPEWGKKQENPNFNWLSPNIFYWSWFPSGIFLVIFSFIARWFSIGFFPVHCKFIFNLK